MPQLAFRAMGCQMLAVVETDSPAAEVALAQVPAWFENWEQRFSRFRPDSELMRLNQAAGRPVPVSAVLWEVVAAALEAEKASGGLVTPTLLKELLAAGYDRSFDDLPAETAAGAAPSSRRTASARAVQRNARARTLTLAAGVQLDLGGIVKGWAADRAARRLGQYGPALVDAGGDIALSAPPSAGAWPIGVADPLTPDEDVEVLHVDRGGVATSGRDYRRWQQGGVWRHHLLDPRTGQPAETDVLSATVVAPSAREAEMAAKAALLLGSQAGLAWIDARPALAALLVLEAGPVERSRRWPAYAPAA